MNESISSQLARQAPDGGPESEVNTRVGHAALSLLRPMARLFLAHGLVYQQAEALLKRAFFDAGQAELNRARIKTNVSRISVTTGLHRRDVKQLSSEEQGPPSDGSASRSHAAAFYIRWSTDSRLVRRDYVLPIRAPGKQISFERLAREISSDAHPRSLLEELSRLGLLEEDEQRGEVRIQPGGFVPILQRSELLELLGENVGAHLETAVSNVMEQGTKYLEQAITEETLPPEAVERLNQLSRQIWQKASKELVTALNLETTANLPKEIAGSHSIRIGMYMHTSLPRSATVKDSTSGRTSSPKKTKRSKS